MKNDPYLQAGGRGAEFRSCPFGLDSWTCGELDLEGLKSLMKYEGTH